MCSCTRVRSLEEHAPHLGSTCKPHASVLHLDLQEMGGGGNESQRAELRRLAASPSWRAEGIGSSLRPTFLRTTPQRTRRPREEAAVSMHRRSGPLGRSLPRGQRWCPAGPSVGSTVRSANRTNLHLLASETISSEVARDSAARPRGSRSAGGCFHCQLGPPTTQRPAAERVGKCFLMAQLGQLLPAARASSAFSGSPRAVHTGAPAGGSAAQRRGHHFCLLYGLHRPRQGTIAIQRRARGYHLSLQGTPRSPCRKPCACVQTIFTAWK